MLSHTRRALLTPITVLRFLLRVRAWEYRQLPKISRVTHPTRPDKARRLGYKAKQGFVIYRVAVRRGSRKRPVPKGIVYGKPKHAGIFVTAVRNLRSVAEERIGRRAPNLRVLNSYWVNQDATYKYYEVILVDPSHAAIRRDPRINWIVAPVHKHREMRGLTSAVRILGADVVCSSGAAALPPRSNAVASRVPHCHPRYLMRRAETTVASATRRDTAATRSSAARAVLPGSDATPQCSTATVSGWPVLLPRCAGRIAPARAAIAATAGVAAAAGRRHGVSPRRNASGAVGCPKLRLVVALRLLCKDAAARLSCMVAWGVRLT